MPERLHPTLSRLACVVAIAMLALGAGCGGGEDENGGGGGGGSDKRAQVAEKAFLTAMVAHHESALDMADTADERGEDPFITRLAADIRSAQVREIAEMKRIYKRRFGATLKPDPNGHDGLGLTAAEAGMTHSPAMNQQLRSARPFDRAFVDEMVPHHKGAIRMANVVLKKTEDDAIRRLAGSISATQKREIEEMNDFRTKKYGSPVPEGTQHGRPSPDAPGRGGDHGGHHPG